VHKENGNMAVRPIPEGYHSLTPSLVIRGAAEAIELYKRAFGATERGTMLGPDNKVMHAELQIGDSRLMLADESPWSSGRSPSALTGTTGSLLIYTEDVDALYAQAIAAGCKPLMPPADMFWGDRYGKVVDPFGHEWELATHKEELTPEELSARAAAAMSQPPTGGQSAE
jgi:uncharacterized glyoxalase superfamily protein PhnB